MPVSPRQFAEERGFSERAVRKLARRLGACRVLGRTMWFEDEDVLVLDQHFKQSRGVSAELKSLRKEYLKRANAQSGPGYVYFLQCEYRVKIGFARNVERRIADIACMCPFPVELLATEAGEIWHEQALHQRFAKSRVHGEWFNLSDEIRDYIAGLPK